MSVAHEKHLLFGRDIASTFGPLGYLISGVALPSTLVHMALWSISIALLFGIATAGSIAVRTTIVERVGFALVFAVLAASSIGEDYLFLFTFLAVLGIPGLFVPARLVSTALALGIAVGLAAMTKFTLAIDCGGAATLFSSGTSHVRRTTDACRGCARRWRSQRGSLR